MFEYELNTQKFQLCTEFNIQPEHYTKLKSLLIQVDILNIFFVMLIKSDNFQENLFPLEKHKTSNSEFESPEMNVKDAVTQYLSHSG